MTILRIKDSEAGQVLRNRRITILDEVQKPLTLLSLASQFFALIREIRDPSLNGFHSKNISSWIPGCIGEVKEYDISI
uniref:AAA_14 domain-containing protein n=1 Tax=Heterorhabditis bacteriophora TaxID=37862 RepID=A0A1I7WTB8_HETBA